MIKREKDVFILETKKTTYCFQVLPSGHLEHLYYGTKIPIPVSVEAISDKKSVIAGNSIAYSKEFPKLGLENVALEMSALGKGDIREPFLELCYADGSRTCDFLFRRSLIRNAKRELVGLPSSYGEKGEVQQLEIELMDEHYHTKLVLTYSVFEECNVITRSARILNESKEPIRLQRLYSAQLDLDPNDYLFTTFTGAWAREMNKTDHLCQQGKVINSAITGTSSNRNNPFVMLREAETTEDYGNCYGMNLIYSGNHIEVVEKNSFGKVRLSCGINPNGFEFEILPHSSFQAPEAVLTFSSEGMQGVSLNMQSFVRNHIVRGKWKDKERPVLINSWEAAYFTINENKLLKMAKSAREAGLELFVMDDGWFGKRNDDTSSLGDWTANKKKLPNGIKGLAEKINQMGMDFGIWVEPEMVNEDSDCYRTHPEWAVKIPGRTHSLGRNQMILDLTRKDVREYLIDSMSAVFESGPISYVKWDMNRIFSDEYSAALSPGHQSEFAHRYVLGLYEILEVLVNKFPDILFEGCASGGNRFDLGMLCYTPQIWASDNTDAMCRAVIQTGYSYGYPMSVVSAHVSGCPNHQTLRVTPLETRFQVACFGVLGYECNLSELSKEEFQTVKEQIAFYKTYRRTLQFGDFYRIKSGKDTDYSKGEYQWISVSKNQSEAIGLYLQGQMIPNSFGGTFKTKGLSEEKTYHFTNRSQKVNLMEFGSLVNMIAPIHIKENSAVHHVVAKFVKMKGETEDYIVGGTLLNKAGIKLKQSFSGTGYEEQMRMFLDFQSRIYIMTEQNESTDSND